MKYVCLCVFTAPKAKIEYTMNKWWTPDRKNHSAVFCPKSNPIKTYTHKVEVFKLYDLSFTFPWGLNFIWLPFSSISLFPFVFIFSVLRWREQQRKKKQSVVLSLFIWIFLSHFEIYASSHLILNEFLSVKGISLLIFHMKRFLQHEIIIIPSYSHAYYSVIFEYLFFHSDCKCGAC